MYIRIIGAILILSGSIGVGFSMAYQYFRSYKALKQLAVAIEIMICEAQCRLSPLNVMCHEAARYTDGIISSTLQNLAAELECQFAPDVYQCMCNAIQKTENLPVVVVSHLKQLSKSLGQFDLDRQIRMLETVLEECRRSILSIDENKQYRVRSYQTLSLCAGAALAVLLI